MNRSDLNQSYAAFEQCSTLACVIELSQKNWLLSGLVPGMKRQPLKKLPAGEQGLLAQIERWRGEAVKAGQAVRTAQAVTSMFKRDGKTREEGTENLPPLFTSLNLGKPFEKGQKHSSYTNKIFNIYE
jgi:hypothetical protein